MERKDHLKMKAHRKKREISLVDQYLNASCFNKISDTTYQNMLSYESKADPIEKKLITRIKEQVKAWKGCAFFWFKGESLISLDVIKNTARRLL